MVFRNQAKLMNRSKKTVRSKGKGKWLDPQIKRRIRAEAKALHLTPKQYLRLLMGLSGSLRTGFLQDKEVDAKELLELVENPIFSTLIQYVSQYARTQADSATKNEHKVDGQRQGTNQMEDKKVQPGRTPGLPYRPETPYGLETPYQHQPYPPQNLPYPQRVPPYPQQVSPYPPPASPYSQQHPIYPNAYGYPQPGYQMHPNTPPTREPPR